MKCRIVILRIYLCVSMRRLAHRFPALCPDCVLPPAFLPFTAISSSSSGSHCTLLREKGGQTGIVARADTALASPHQ